MGIKNIVPAYDLNKINPSAPLRVDAERSRSIKFATDEATFKRAVGLYESGKVTEVEALGGYYSAVVQGTESYRVSVSARNYKQGHCTCYVGQNDRLCKHMVALALYAVMAGKPLNDKDKQITNEVKFIKHQKSLKLNYI